MSFKRTCPVCRAKDRIIKRCSICYGFRCSDCSATGICIDCYIEQNGKKEIDIYFNDKYSEGVSQST